MDSTFSKFHAVVLKPETKIYVFFSVMVMYRLNLSYMTVEGRVSLEFLLSPISYIVAILCHNFFSILNDNRLTKSCRQRYYTRDWHDAVCLRLYDTNGYARTGLKTMKIAIS